MDPIVSNGASPEQASKNVKAYSKMNLRFLYGVLMLGPTVWGTCFHLVPIFGFASNKTTVI
jgi:hypothetical protein